jgi:hypothetical protein
MFFCVLNFNHATDTLSTKRELGWLCISERVPNALDLIANQFQFQFCRMSTSLLFQSFTTIMVSADALFIEVVSQSFMGFELCSIFDC